MTQFHPTEPIATFELSLTAKDISNFFEAVGWQLPEKPVSPPTLATIFRNGEFQALQKLNIPLHKVLHGEQKYRFLKDLEAGKTYRGQTFLNSHYEKSGGSGSMNFYVFQTNLSQDGITNIECLTTIIARG